MRFYISPGAALLLLIFYAPIVLYVVRRLWRHLTSRADLSRAKRISACLLTVIGAAAIPLWDVTITSVQMATLCPRAGIFVTRSVKVDGFYTNFGSPDMLERGFNYIESRSYGNRLVVYTKEGDAVKKEEFDARTYQVKSRYEFIYGAERGAHEGRSDIGIRKSVVRDRETKEEFGYSIRYTAYPGWFDQNTMGRIYRFQWSCPNIFPQDLDLLRQVLLPKDATSDRAYEGAKK